MCSVADQTNPGGRKEYHCSALSGIHGVPFARSILPLCLRWTLRTNGLPMTPVRPGSRIRPLTANRPVSGPESQLARGSRIAAASPIACQAGMTIPEGASQSSSAECAVIADGVDEPWGITAHSLRSRA